MDQQNSIAWFDDRFLASQQHLGYGRSIVIQFSISPRIHFLPFFIYPCVESFIHGDIVCSPVLQVTIETRQIRKFHSWNFIQHQGFLMLRTRVQRYLDVWKPWKRIGMCEVLARQGHRVR